MRVGPPGALHGSKRAGALAGGGLCFRTMPEGRSCQNCKGAFVVADDDVLFYQKIQVPPPTFCSTCRFQRRTMFRNERVLYKRKCDLCTKDMVSTFAPDKPYVVYCNPCWWSDKWDTVTYARDYNPRRNFFEQFQELTLQVPLPALVIDYPTLVNSEYVNHVGHCKNCYLVFDTDYAENVLYATIANRCKDSMDLKLVESSELCYEDVNCDRCFNTFFSEDCSACHDVYFSKNCAGCSHCIGCINLRNKQYHVFNEPFPKEAFERKLMGFQFEKFSAISDFQTKAHAFWKQYPMKSMHGTHNVNVTGDYVYESKNGRALYQCRGVEDGRYCQRLSVSSSKDVGDYTEWGYNAQRIYECVTVGEQAGNIRFCSFCFKNVWNVEYSIGVVMSSDIFGCVGLRNKKFCILNKAYPQSAFQSLREGIIRDMEARPYRDGQGRTFSYGEFFPYDLSFFDYDESTAMQYFPLEEAQVRGYGWRWRGWKPGTYSITKAAADLPDDIHDVSQDVTKEIVECAECRRAFRVITAELDLLKRFSLPLPRKCSECRHMDRMRRLNPPQLWVRTCAKCTKNIETSYSPDRPEIVYCESCYNAEVV